MVRDTRPYFIGAEQELFLRPAVKRKAQKELMRGLDPRDRFSPSCVYQDSLPGDIKEHKGKPCAKWTVGGGVFYQDSAVRFPSCADQQEFATPLIEQSKGCATQLWDAILLQKALALSPAATGGVESVVRSASTSTHYNVGVEPSMTKALASLCTRSVAVAHAYYLPGMGTWYRHPDGRVEICGLAGVPVREQAIAGMAVLVGTIKGLERLLAEAGGSEAEVSQRLPLHLEGVRAYKPDFKEGYAISYPGDMRADTEFKTNRGKMTARDITRAYVEFFRDDILGVATSEEWEYIERFLNHEKPMAGPKTFDAAYLLSQSGQDVHGIIHGYRPPLLAALYEESTLQSKKDLGSGVTRTTQAMDWSGILYRYSCEGTSIPVYMPVERYREYAGLLEKHEGSPRELYRVVAERFAPPTDQSLPSSRPPLTKLQSWKCRTWSVIDRVLHGHCT